MKTAKFDIYVSEETKNFYKRCAANMGLSESSLLNLIVNDIKKHLEAKYGKKESEYRYSSTSFFK